MNVKPAAAFLVAFFLALTTPPYAGAQAADASFEQAFSDVDRVWAGPEYWANRLQDWRLEDGRLTNVAPDQPLRTVHLLTRRLAPRAGSLRMETDVRLGAGGEGAGRASAGFLVGAGAPDLDYRAAALVHHRPGADGGYYAGIARDGTLFLRSHQGREAETLAEGRADGFVGDALLRLELTADHVLRLTAMPAGGGAALGRVEAPLPDRDLAGSLALVADRAPASFGGWLVDGTRVEAHPGRTLGPIVSTQYTLSEGILTMSAQFAPIGEADNRIARLQVYDDGAWVDVDADDVASPAYVAVFRVRGWDDTRDHDYRVAYDLAAPGGAVETHTWGGTIRHDPVEKRVVTVAGFTGNHNVRHGFTRVQAGYAFDAAHLWFPHADVVDHVRAHDPDLLFFSGDQVYEGDSPTPPDREHIMLDYLYKWYLYCWAYRDLTRDLPTISIPDDHDVFQGNIWGEGGRATDKDDKGGYVHPASFVRMVEKTQTSNLPPPADPRPIDQGIGVYFTDLEWGRIGFAVVEDRKFKSGPNGKIPNPTSERADHIADPSYDVSKIDLPGLTLLGERQLRFLEAWAADWKGENMKAVLSQTVFAGMATHHGAELFRLWADLDSNGWPQSGRNRALAAMRKGFAFHLAGDQHLSTVVHHGIETHGDAGYSFAVPSIANFYPRAWSPEAEGENRPAGTPPYMGEHHDGLGHPVTVHAVYNPPGFTGVSTGVAPLALHDSAPGYGIVRFDKATREITMENWPRYADPSDPSAEPYDTWPVVIDQADNYGRAAAAHLPELRVSGLEDPVVQVVHEATGEVVYTLRIEGTTFRPKVFDAGARYTVKVGDPDTGQEQVFRGVTPESGATLPVTF